MSNLEKRIGGKITEVRLGKRMTQAGLAEKIGLSVESISRMERGASFPSLKTVERVAIALDTPLRNFFEFDDQPAETASFERELSKLTAFLRTRSEEEITQVHRILRVVFRSLGKAS